MYVIEYREESQFNANRSVSRCLLVLILLGPEARG